jgi:hypothetical protein
MNAGIIIPLNNVQNFDRMHSKYQAACFMSGLALER